MALIALAAVQIALDIGAVVYSILNRPKVPTASPIIGQISGSADGAPIPFGYGTDRIGGQIIWSSGIDFTKRSQSAKGGPTITFYTYFASLAIAWAEGPLTVKRIWADTKLVWVAPGLTSQYPVEDFTPWSSTALYQPGNIVSRSGQIYQSNTVNQNVEPDTDTDEINWTLISDYPPWRNDFDYSVGDVVMFGGGNSNLWVAMAPSIDIAPGSGNTTQVNGATVPYWLPMNLAYPQPVHYPGNESQLPDPTIQSFEGTTYTGANRGLAYSVYTRFPILNFGNRVPNWRAEVQYQKTCTLL